VALGDDASGKFTSAGGSNSVRMRHLTAPVLQAT
jgi:hypothetical protein